MSNIRTVSKLFVIHLRGAYYVIHLLQKAEKQAAEINNATSQDILACIRKIRHGGSQAAQVLGSTSHIV